MDVMGCTGNDVGKTGAFGEGEEKRGFTGAHNHPWIGFGGSGGVGEVGRGGAWPGCFKSGAFGDAHSG